MNTWGYCYLLWYRDVNTYKIGFGKSAKKRHLQLQRTYPKPLYLVGSCRCFNPRNLEKHLHQQYGTQRQPRSEFFHLTDDNVADILETFKRLEGSTIEPHKLAVAV